LVYFVASIIKYFQDTKDLLYLKRYYFYKIQEFYRLVCRLAQNLPENILGLSITPRGKYLPYQITNKPIKNRFLARNRHYFVWG